MSDRVPIAKALAWPHIVRSAVPMVYLDLNHYINLAKTAANRGRAPEGYRELLRACRKARDERRALFPLSTEHLAELSAVADPAQREAVASVMATLSEFQYLLGRPDLAALEIGGALDKVTGTSTLDLPAELHGRGFGRAFGMVGGLGIVDSEGHQAGNATRRAIGPDAFDTMLEEWNLELERAMLAGPPDDEIEALRQGGYAPELAQAAQQSRVEFEQSLSNKLASEPRWRRGRLRDVVSAREISHEWLDIFNRVQERRRVMHQSVVTFEDPEMSEVWASLPHVQVAIEIKTVYHRNPHHRWTRNDIFDIDAISVAYAYCDAVFTDKSVRSAIVSSKLERQFSTFMPRTPHELTAWLDQLAPISVPELLLPVSAFAKSA